MQRASVMSQVLDMWDGMDADGCSHKHRLGPPESPLAAGAVRLSATRGTGQSPDPAAHLLSQTTHSLLRQPASTCPRPLT